MKYIKTYENFNSAPISKGAEIEIAKENQDIIENDLNIEQIELEAELEEEKEEQENTKNKKVA